MTNQKQSKKGELVYNAIKTPDGTILESTHQHDFKIYKDKNNETYLNDGGTEYLKRSINKEPYEDLSLYTSDKIEILREHCSWGTYGKDTSSSPEKLTHKKIKYLSNAHINNILRDFGNKVHHGIILREFEYRAMNNIIVKDEVKEIKDSKDNEDNKDSEDTLKDVHRCDLNKPCVQYCSSDKTKCGVLVKRLLGESVERSEVSIYKNKNIKVSCLGDSKIDTLGKLIKKKKGA